MFWAARPALRLDVHARRRRAGLSPRHDASTRSSATAAHVGLWYFDPYARDGKRSGAWMNEYRTQEAFTAADHADRLEQRELREGQGGRAGADLVGRRDDACSTSSATRCTGSTRTSRYPTLAGTNTKRDFVEFPSQLNEHWLPTPEVLERFALHYKTGKPIPAELVAKIEKRQALQPGLQDRRVPGVGDLRHEDPPGAGRSGRSTPARSRRRRWRRSAARREIVMRHRPTAVRPHLLRRRLLGRLLRLHLGRHADRRRRRGVQRGAAASTTRRRRSGCTTAS